MKTHNETPLSYQIPDACQRLGVGKTTLYALIHAKEIKPIKVGRRTLITEAELQRWVASKQEAA